MSWHCSRAVVAEFLGASSSNGEPCVLLKSTPTAGPSSSNGRTKATLNPSRFGTTCGALSELPGGARWMSSLVDFPVSHSPSLGSGAERTMNATSGRRPSESFAKWDRGSRCWRTFQGCLLTTTSEPFSGTWPRAGIGFDGECYRRLKWEHRISEIGCGFLPTPRAQESGDYQYDRGDHSKPRLTLTGLARTWPTPIANAGRGGDGSEGNLPAAVKLWPTPGAGDAQRSQMKPESLLKVRAKSVNRPKGAPSILAHEVATAAGGQQTQLTGSLNPAWVAWLMGFPIAWVSLEPSATPKSPSARRLHFDSWLKMNRAALEQLTACAARSR